MDLLELEDGLIVHDSTDAGVNQPNIGSDFPEEEDLQGHHPNKRPHHQDSLRHLQGPLKGHHPKGMVAWRHHHRIHQDSLISLWSIPSRRPNPMTEIELRYEDLFLLEIRHVLTEPLQQVLGSTIDAYKWALINHLHEVYNFRLPISELFGA